MGETIVSSLVFVLSRYRFRLRVFNFLKIPREEFILLLGQMIIYCIVILNNNNINTYLAFMIQNTILQKYIYVYIFIT